MELTEEQIKKYLENNNFPTIKNTCLLDAAMGKLPEKVPVWIMRQVGTYLPEYQIIKKDHTYGEIIKTPKLACEATIMQIRHYDLDAAFLFCDVLVVPEALGINVDYSVMGPIIRNPLTLGTLKDLDWQNAIQKLSFVGDAMKLARHKLQGKAPIIGYAATPWTLMVYMIEGALSKSASTAKNWLFAYEDQAQQLLDRLKILLIKFLVMQVKNGASILLLFEKVADHLDLPTYERLIFPKVIGIRESVRAELEKLDIPTVPFMIFANGADRFLHLQLKSNFEIVGVDWINDPKHFRHMHPNVTLQANLHPLTFASNRANVMKHVDYLFYKFGYRNTIINLGCSIFPHMNLDAIEWCIDTIHARMPA